MSLVWVYASRIDQCELLSWSDIDLVLLQECCPLLVLALSLYIGNKYGKMYYLLGLPFVVFNLYEGNEGRSSALRDMTSADVVGFLFRRKEIQYGSGGYSIDIRQSAHLSFILVVFSYPFFHFVFSSRHVLFCHAIEVSRIKYKTLNPAKIVICTAHADMFHFE